MSEDDSKIKRVEYYSIEPSEDGERRVKLIYNDGTTKTVKVAEKDKDETGNNKNKTEEEKKERIPLTIDDIRKSKYASALYTALGTASAASVVAACSQIFDLDALYSLFFSGISVGSIISAATKFSKAKDEFNEYSFQSGDGKESDLTKFFNSISIALASGTLAAGAVITDINEFITYTAAMFVAISAGMTRNLLGKIQEQKLKTNPNTGNEIKK